MPKARNSAKTVSKIDTLLTFSRKFDLKISLKLIFSFFPKGAASARRPVSQIKRP